VKNGFVIILVFFCIASSPAQQRTDVIRVDESFHHIPLSKVLKKIQSRYKVKIAYDNALIQNVMVDIVFAATPFDEAFDRLLKNTPLTFNRVDDNVIIFPRPPSMRTIQPKRFDFTLAGNILDEQTHETLPNAIVKVSGTNLVASTNKDGYFTIPHIPNDTSAVDISCVGYITQSIQLSGVENPTKFNARLKDDTKILDEVVVTDKYNQAIHIDEKVSKIAFNPRAVATLPSLGEQDISRTMQLLPGICATDESSSGMIIRGMHPGYNLVLLDGMTIYQQDHFFGAYSIINSDVVKDVQVSRGVFDPKYGGRVSGVVDITTKNGNAVKPAFNIKANFINAKASAEIPISKKISFFIAGRRSFTDFARSALYKNLFNIARASDDQIQPFPLDPTGRGQDNNHPSFYFYDANMKLTYKPTDRDIISFSLYQSRDHLRERASLNNDAAFISNKEISAWGNTGLSLRWGRQWNEKFYTTGRISYSSFFKHFRNERTSDTDSTQNTFGVVSKNSISDLTIAIDGEWSINKSLTAQIGVSTVRQQTTLDARDYFVDNNWGFHIDSTNVSEWQSTVLASVYAGINASITNQLNVSAGVRGNMYIYNLLGNKILLAEPRVTVNYKLNDHLNLKAAYGRSNQFINQFTFYGSNGFVSGVSDHFWLLAEKNSNVPVTSMNHAVLGATLRANSFVLDAEPYVKYSKGLVTYTDITRGTNIMYGIDLILQKTSGIHKGWIAYSLSKSEQSSDSIQRGKFYPSLLDQRHQLKVINMLTLGHWSLSSTYIYGSGKPYPSYNAQYLKNSNGDIEGYSLQYDYKNASRSPAYYRFDIAASYKMNFGKTNAEIGLSIFNLTNHKNIKTKKIDIDRLNEARKQNTELPVSWIDVKSMNITPSLFISISF
jgi:ferric enterobactin receptor